jgi:aminopeptidase
MVNAMPSNLSHEDRLDRLAEIAIRTGLGLQPGQEVVLTAPLPAMPLVRRVTEHAYKAGATLVTTLLSDDESTLARFKYASDAAFDTAPGWMFEGMANAYRAGAARLAIGGENPALLAGQDAGKVARANRARSVAYRPALELITNFDTNWSIVTYATPSWAKLMFPDLPEDEAVAKLWDAIFAASRVDEPDPVAAWAEHNATLHAKTKHMNAKRYESLHFRGPGTDLRVGLSDGHLWLGGSEPSKNGIVCNPNIPSEEIFTTPHKDRVDGYVRSTKPLAYQGTLIKDIAVRFEAGRIIEATASAGQNVLEKVLDTDEGARRLGEVALVTHSSPISASGLLFFNTLFDENAASHVAIGQAYRTCLEGGTTASEAELASRGANTSLIHIDWMIGSGEIDVDGVLPGGSSEPVMRQGEWV